MAPFFFSSNILQIKIFAVLYIPKRWKTIQESASLGLNYFFPFMKLEIGFVFGITLRMDDEQNEDKCNEN